MCRGAAYGNDGRISYTICRAIPEPEGNNEIIGWSAEVEGEVNLGREKVPALPIEITMTLISYGYST